MHQSPRRRSPLLLRLLDPLTILLVLLGAGAVLAAVTCTSGCTSSDGKRDYLGSACKAVKVAILTAEDYESMHPGELAQLPARIEEARSVLDLFCGGGEITLQDLDDLREMGPLLRTVLARSGWDTQRIESTMLGLSVVLNLVEVYHASPGASNDTAMSIPECPPGSSGSYQVCRGDTLWTIAQKRLGSGSRWREIASANGISNPSRLRVGASLSIPTY